MRNDPIVRAAHALTTLNTFASVVTILEGGHVYESKSHATAEKIIALCKREQQKLLVIYDDAVDAARAPQGGKR